MRVREWRRRRAGFVVVVGWVWGVWEGWIGEVLGLGLGCDDDDGGGGAEEEEEEEEMVVVVGDGWRCGFVEGLPLAAAAAWLDAGCTGPRRCRRLASWGSRASRSSALDAVVAPADGAAG